jgi:hypothetical protein
VVVCPDGELYELEIGLDHEAIEETGSWDPLTARKEVCRKLDLPPLDYLLYASSALAAVTEQLVARQKETAR